ncbi:hypothetical protein [Brevibacillus laterosporus]|uniref:hypothetical protein n=1 Tax=Brevibacillus laterosporus TaxID=1465 RepID=UPI00264BA320|nr:hypothetical protein [Brevibacillus laterosporus]MDN9012454.1 hypothetical protein [Brevibacillus laterosporus]MDO0943483.1 hypothetical protein [Brevibacillus laterosporus]
MARTKLKQYSDTIIVNERQLDDLAETMEAVLEYGVIQMDDNKLASNISLGTAIAGTVFNLIRPAAIAVGIVSLVTSLSTNLRGDLENNIEKAVRDLHRTRRFMRDNPQYTKLEIEFPFMDYDDIRLITGKGLVTRLYGKSGWIEM